MAKFTKYPTAVDTSTQLPIVTDNVTPVKGAVINPLQESIIAIQTELGPNPSGTYSTVKARLDALEVAGVGSGGTGTGNVAVKANSSLVDAQTNVLNFLGDVSITDGPAHQVNITVGGGASLKQELFTASSNGQSSFTLSGTPVQSNAVQMYLNGIKQIYGVDYIVSGTAVHYSGTIPLIIGDALEFWYVVTLGTLASSSGSTSTTTVTAIKTGTYTTALGEIVRCNPSSGGFTINLPTAFSNTGFSIVIKNVTSSTNTITIQATGLETIDGSSTQTMTVGYQSFTLISDGVNWMIT